MKSRFLLVFACMVLSPVSISADVTPVDAALARADAFGEKMKFSEAVDTLRPYADLGNAKVEFSLANAYMELAVIGKKPDAISAEAIHPAIDFAQRAVAHGWVDGYNLLALIYSNGWGVPVDSAKGADYLRRGAEAGGGGAKLNYAIALYNGAPAIPRNVNRACTMFHDLLHDDTSDVIAGYYMGVIEFRGQCGRSPDKAAGIALIKIAADHEVRDAERDMGKNFEFGWVDPVDKQKAFDWYQKAADHGDPEAQWWIGMAYVDGVLRPHDSVKGVQYLEEAAASDDPRGLTDLGVMYVTGDGVKLDSDKARSLYERAAALNQPHAYRELATMYAMGEGVPIDLVRARVLFLQSVELGEKDIHGFRAAIEVKLDAGQIKASDQQFEEWKKRNVVQ